jgi:hypothetical protein
MKNIQSVSIVPDNRLYDWGSIPERDMIFPLASVSRPAMRHTQPPTQWVPGHLVGHFWTTDRSVEKASTYTGQHNTERKIQTSMP